VEVTWAFQAEVEGVVEDGCFEEEGEEAREESPYLEGVLMSHQEVEEDLPHHHQVEHPSLLRPSR
jgi:hypothetical protein